MKGQQTDSDSEQGDKTENSSLLNGSILAPESSRPTVSYFQLFQGTPASTKAYFTVGVVAAFCTGALYSTMFYLMGQIFDESSEESEDDYDMYHETCKIAYIWMTLGVLITVSGYICSYCFTRVSQRIGLEFRKRYFHAILSRDMEYFDKHNVAELPSAMSRDCELVEGGVGDKFMFFIEIATYTLFGMGIVFEKCPQLFLIGFAIAPFELLGTALLGYGILKGVAVKQSAYLKAAAISEEALVDVKTVASFNAQDHVCDKYVKELEEPGRVAAKMSAIKGLGNGVMWMTWMMLGVVMFWVPAKWISDERKNWVWGDDIEGTDAIVCFWIVSFVSIRLGSMAPGITASLEARAAGARALAFIEEPVAFVNGAKQRVLTGAIEFRDVHFAYPKHPEKPVLRGVSFLCESHKKTAIVGESGAGKSTIIQLMERFYEPIQGTVFYDDCPVQDLEIGFLRGQIGYVSQEPVLFNLTIEDNIRLGRPDVTAEEIETAAKESNAYDFVMALQDGFHTNVGVKGSKLSGGQKQRIAIARAMVKKPKILLLDEATSALDNESEEIVLRAINTIHSRQALTVVSVAQKLSTVRNADKIVVLRDCQVEEEGSHEELLQRNGLYASMCAAQGVSHVAESTLQVQAMSEPHSSVGSQVQEQETAVTSLRHFPFVRLYRSALEYWPLLLAGLISATAAGAMYPLFGYAVGKITYYISGPSGGKMEDNVQKFCLMLLGLSVVTFISFAGTQWAFGVMTARLTQTVRTQSFKKMLNLDAEYFDRSENNAGLLTHNLNIDAEKVNEAGGPLFGAFLSIAVGFLLGTVISIYWQWRLGIVNFVAFPLEYFSTLRGYVIRMSGLTHPQHQRASALALDAIMNVKTITACHAQSHMEERYLEKLSEVFENTRSETHWNGFSYGISLGMAFFAITLSFWYGAYLKNRDQAGEEDVDISIFTSMLTVLGAVASATFAPDIAEGSHAAVRIYKVIDYRPSIDSSQTSGLTTEISGNVSLQNVSFKYAGRDNLVLRNVSFDLPVGKHIGITGASGSGKTTLSQLILRFYDVTEGCITFDGVDIRNYNIRHLRASIAMVGQEPVLFSGTIRDNVDFGLNKSDEEIKQALVHASIGRFAEELDRDVGTRGSLVSGGQKQRIAIARAILRAPKLLLLDEATSALDSKTEKKILSALEYAGQGRTVLMIAHRLSTIEKCDEILVMDAGEVKERGTHEQLISQPGSIYQKLRAAAK